MQEGNFCSGWEKGAFPGWRRGAFPWGIPSVEEGEFFLGWGRGTFATGMEEGFFPWDVGGDYSLVEGERFCPWVGGRGFFLVWEEEDDFFPVWEKRDFSLGGRREISAWVGRGGILLMGKKRRISPNGVREGNFSWV